jgi:RNA polymerase sigma-32 factor
MKKNITTISQTPNPPTLGGLSNLPAINKDSDWLNGYISYVKNLPILSDTEESELIKRVKDHKDRAAAEKIVSAHLRMVVSTAYEMQSYGVGTMQDLIAEGTIGLLKALDKFDPDKGVRFSVYANYWIKAELYSMIWDQWSMVKIGENPARKKVFFNLGRAKRALGIMDSKLSGENIKQIANYLEVPEKEVELMSSRMARDMSLNAKFSSEDTENEFIDTLQNEDPTIGDILEKKETATTGKLLLKKYLNELNDRDRDIITRRRLIEKPDTLDDLAQKYGISKERVRQIENRVFDTLQKNILSDNNAKKIEFSDSPKLLKFQ